MKEFEAEIGQIRDYIEYSRKRLGGKIPLSRSERADVPDLSPERFDRVIVHFQELVASLREEMGVAKTKRVDAERWRDMNEERRLDVEEKAADYECAASDLLERVLTAAGIDAHDPFGDEEQSGLVSVCNEIERFLRPPSPQERALAIIMRFSDVHACGRRCGHRMWVADQVVRALTGADYEAWVDEFNRRSEGRAAAAEASSAPFRWNQGTVPPGAPGALPGMLVV